MNTPGFKSGFVNIIGPPNAGKSTLLNALLGENLSIVNPKAQTTRHRIKGIKTTKNFQIVFSDTPGVLDPAYPLQETMMEGVWESLEDADFLILVCAADDELNLDLPFYEKLKKTTNSALVLLNKIDLLDQENLERKVQELHEKFSKFEILPISATEKFNLDFLVNKIVDQLPEGPMYFPEDQWTDVSERFLVNEKIREKILDHYQQEIPYAIKVETEIFKREEGLIRIHSVVYCERESQKAILIGHKGKGILRIGKEARLDLEKFFDTKIFLEIFVKVNKDWRKNEGFLKSWHNTRR